MKIIGKTEEGFIIEASKDDVAAMEGLYAHAKRFEVGDLIDIYQLFSKINSLDIAFNNIDRLKDAAEKAIEAATWIEEFRKK